MEYRKRVDALVFFSFLLVGYFAAHAYDEKGMWKLYKYVDNLEDVISW
jgi:hypothetical protein